MANIYQQAATRRKVIYLGAIGVLLLCTLVVRGTVKIPIPGVKEFAYNHSLEGQAREYELTELSQGEAELGGSAVRLLLTGSRGLAVCALWNGAIEKQRRQEWSELDIAVKSITKLQPHFTAPWLFQSWNITYNVSVEMDRLNDMYYYIARGISIIAEGEALNRNNPDLRYNLGFYFQNKFGVSDKVTTLRCLHQLSCIPDQDRDPEKLLNPDRTVNAAEFEKFCVANPQLIRRLKTIRVSPDGSEERARPLVDRPEGVVTFLRNNRKLPSRYKTGTKELNDRLKQFPVLPDLRDRAVPTKEVDFLAELGDSESDAFLVARAWYAFANQAVPPPNPVPGSDVVNPDPYKYRLPKRPTLMVFRQGAVRAQTYHADRLAKEAWFDREPWELDDVAGDQTVWVKKTDAAGKPTSLKLTTPTTAQDAWKEAAVRWREHGRANGLYMDPTKVAVYAALADEYVRAHPGTRVGSMPEALTAEERNDPELEKRHEAMRVMNSFSADRHVTQYEAFDVEAEAMATDDAMLAMKLFHRAEKANREELRVEKSAALYEQAFAAWLRLLSRQECRARPGVDPGLSVGQPCRDLRDLDRYQETVYEHNLKYLRVAHDLNLADRRAASLWLSDLVKHSAGAGTNPFQFIGDLAVLADRVPAIKSVTPLPIPGPVDGVAETDGKPWVRDDIKDKVMQRLGLVKTAPAPPVGGGGRPGPPGS